MELENSFIYGELTDNYDCPQSGGVCDSCVERSGIILNLNGDHKDKEIKQSMLPLFA